MLKQIRKHAPSQFEGNRVSDFVGAVSLSAPIRMGMKISGNAGRVLFCCQSWLRSRSLLFVWFYFWSFPAAYCPELAEVGVQCPLKCPAHFAVQIHPGGGGQVRNHSKPFFMKKSEPDNPRQLEQIDLRIRTEFGPTYMGCQETASPTNPTKVFQNSPNSHRIRMNCRS